MEKNNHMSVCGTDCSTCYCFGTMCKGCNECEGKIFYAPEGKVCEIYHCVLNEKSLHNCKNCKELPCQIWMDKRDPKFTDEEFKENIEMRVNNLKHMEE